MKGLYHPRCEISCIGGVLHKTTGYSNQQNQQTQLDGTTVTAPRLGRPGLLDMSQKRRSTSQSCNSPKKPPGRMSFQGNVCLASCLLLNSANVVLIEKKREHITSGTIAQLASCIVLQSCELKSSSVSGQGSLKQPKCVHQRPKYS
jgi:hypothetical protein